MEITGTFKAADTISSESGDVVSSKQSLDALFNHKHGPGSYVVNHDGERPVTGDSATFGEGGSKPGATGPGALEAAIALQAEIKKMVEKVNVLLEFADENKWERNTQNIKTTADRFMTFEPCPEHVNKGKQG